jgi:ABC-2 type transport system ATP-binding protein
MTKLISNYSAEFELDISVLELNCFIDLINQKGRIMDLSIQELPIEEVIKELYLGVV